MRVSADAGGDFELPLQAPDRQRAGRQVRGQLGKVGATFELKRTPRAAPRRRCEKAALTDDERCGIANTLTPSPESNADAHLIWLRPVDDIQQRETLWSKIVSGDLPEGFR